MTETPHPASLHAEGLSVSFGNQVALAPLDLTLPGGVLVAATGASGAGKTTLLWALSGALPPTRGRVLLDGHEMRTRVEAALRGVAIVPQGNALVSALTARENVLVAVLERDGAARDPAGARTAEALATVGLAESADHLVHELSGGQQQRVAVARALAQRPRVLLADEPTSDLDAVSRTRVIQALRETAARGALVVMATHDPEAADLADAELALDEGHARWVRAP